MSEDDPSSLAEQFEQALEAWSEYDWEDGDEVVLPVCDLENPEVCEACD